MKKISSRRVFLQNFLIVFLPLFFVAGGLSYYAGRTKTDAALKRIDDQLTQEVNTAKTIAGGVFLSLVTDLLDVSHSYELGKVVNGLTVDLGELTEEFIRFSNEKKIYDQIRYLDNRGQEIVRINFINGRAVAVSAGELQNKAERYYFRDSFALHDGEVFISPFDLNVEHGELEMPLKPMIRLATPVFDRNAERHGVVLLNYSGSYLLRKLETASGKRVGELSLLNAAGYWLKGMSPDEEWGFMYDDRQEMTFGNRYPRAWEKMQGGDSGRFRDENGLFVFATFYPLAIAHKSSTGSGKPFAASASMLGKGEYFYKIVSHIPRQQLLAATRGVLKKWWYVFSAAVFVSAGIALGFAYSRENGRRETSHPV